MLMRTITAITAAMVAFGLPSAVADSGDNVADLVSHGDFDGPALSTFLDEGGGVHRIVLEWMRPIPDGQAACTFTESSVTGDTAVVTDTFTATSPGVPYGVGRWEKTVTATAGQTVHNAIRCQTTSGLQWTQSWNFALGEGRPNHAIVFNAPFVRAPGSINVTARDHRPANCTLTLDSAQRQLTLDDDGQGATWLPPAEQRNWTVTVDCDNGQSTTVTRFW